MLKGLLREYKTIPDLVEYLKENPDIIYVCTYDEFVHCPLMDGFIKCNEILFNPDKTTAALSSAFSCFRYNIDSNEMKMEIIFHESYSVETTAKIRLQISHKILEDDELQDILRERQLKLIQYFFRFPDSYNPGNYTISTMFLSIFTLLIEPDGTKELIFKACDIMNELEFYDVEWMEYRYSQNSNLANKIVIQLHPDLKDDAINIFEKHRDFFESLYVILYRKTLSIPRVYSGGLEKCNKLHLLCSYVDVIHKRLEIFNAIEEEKPCITTTGSLQRYIKSHPEIIGVKNINRVTYDSYVYSVSFFDLKGTTESIFIAIEGSGDIEKFIYRLLEDNISNLFKSRALGKGATYHCPLDPRLDKSTKTFMSAEKTVIINHAKHGSDLIKSIDKLVFDSCPHDTIESILMPSKIRVSFRQYGDYKFSKSKDLFNGIVVEVPIIHYNFTKEEVIKIIKKNRKKIDRIVLEKINEQKRFRHSELTMSYFSLDNLTLTSSYELIYTFGLKKALEDMNSVEK